MYIIYTVYYNIVYTVYTYVCFCSPDGRSRPRRSLETQCEQFARKDLHKIIYTYKVLLIAEFIFLLFISKKGKKTAIYGLINAIPGNGVQWMLRFDRPYIENGGVFKFFEFAKASPCGAILSLKIILRF